MVVLNKSKFILSLIFKLYRILYILLYMQYFTIYEKNNKRQWQHLFQKTLFTNRALGCLFRVTTETKREAWLELLTLKNKQTYKPLGRPKVVKTLYVCLCVCAHSHALTCICMCRLFQPDAQISQVHQWGNSLRESFCILLILLYII